MAQPRCLASSSPARALHRVLVSDLLSRSTNPSSTTKARHAISSYYLFPPRLFSTSSRLPSNRPALSLIAASKRQHVRTLTTTPPLQRIDAFKKRIINDKIPYQWIRIASAPPENALSSPQRTDIVLRSLNPKTHTLLMVATPPETTSENADEPRAAICRIIDNAAASAAAAETERLTRRKAIDSKELEFSWSIAGHDLAHKLRRLREFLDKGLNVEVILAKKKKGRTATKEEAQAVLVAVREAVASVEGAKEVRKMEGNVGGLARLYFEGVSGKKKSKKKQEVAEED
ncbi:uncharacterized protein F4822DRAFT_394817 [Hypoxylon trugodes]|uniref:uncharacterized protein n=1 Tax=Hypoxylon trugodes TaxID=326681 RepID=UPI002191E558|nr:uncharacterized protein F4822DRAFT_394817 [Hypoxylon trugodes]KAI1390904.1 hypothetical protein F4822DRAFT_394817 [Hypoxylon trugodes]